MPSIEPPHTVGSPALLQSWRDTSFFHWEVEPEAVAALLPAGLEPDLHQHRAWVGLTPFRVEGQRLSGTPPLPWWSSYRESNLRTYVRGPDGDGIWFLTIHATSLPTVLGAQTVLGAPYRPAAITIRDRGSEGYHYQLDDHRPHPSESFDVAITPGRDASVDRSDLATFLTGRWRAYTRHPLAGLVAVHVVHQPWEPRPADATLTRLPSSLLALTDGDMSRCLAHVSTGVDARLGGWVLESLRRHGRGRPGAHR